MDSLLTGAASVRTQIFLTAKLKERAIEFAELDGISLGLLIRQSLAEKLTEETWNAAMRTARSIVGRTHCLGSAMEALESVDQALESEIRQP